MSLSHFISTKKSSKLYSLAYFIIQILHLCIQSFSISAHSTESLGFLGVADMDRQITCSLTGTISHWMMDDSSPTHLLCLHGAVIAHAAAKVAPPILHCAVIAPRQLGLLHLFFTTPPSPPQPNPNSLRPNLKNRQR